MAVSMPEVKHLWKSLIDPRTVIDYAYDMIKAIIFDLDDTLFADMESAYMAFSMTCQYAHQKCGIDPKKLHKDIREICRYHWYRAPMRPYIENIGMSSWEGLWARFGNGNKDLDALNEWAPTYRMISWDEALRRNNINDPILAQELVELFPSNRRKCHKVYDDVVPAIESVKDNYKLALLTNGATGLQREKIGVSGLNKYFSTIVISGEFGIGKPDIRIYEHTLSLLNAKAEETVMVGNSLKSDIDGANKSGIKSIWLNRPDNDDHYRDLIGTVIPDYEIDSLNGLAEFLSNIG